MDTLLNKDTESSNFIHQVVKKGKATLDYYTDEANLLRKEHIREQSILNMSLTQILQKLSVTMIEILDDIIKNRINSISDVVKGDRIIYIGIFVVLIALCLYIVDITS
jgi:hypothetical protein